MEPTASPQPFEFTVRRLPGYVSVKVRGEATLDDMVRLIDTMAFETRQHRDLRVLVDLLAVTNELKFTDHFQIGEQAARKLQNLDRLASVVPENRITHTSEKVAQHQGMQLRVFTSMDAATAWVTQG